MTYQYGPNPESVLRFTDEELINMPLSGVGSLAERVQSWCRAVDAYEAEQDWTAP